MLGARRRCTAVLADGRNCPATPLRDGPFCFWHAPEREEEATEARRLGGLRRRREKTLSGAYDFAGLGSVAAIRRILESAVLDALGLDNSIARARVLIAGGLAAARLLEIGDLEERLEALEAAHRKDEEAGVPGSPGGRPLRRARPVTLARRLAKLEASRTPTEVVLAWLAEAQAYATLPEYVGSLSDAPKEAWPLGRIAAQVEASVRASVKGKTQDVWQAVRRAVGDAWFLFELVLQLNVAARQIRDLEGLRWALLTKWLGLLSTEAELAERTGHGDAEQAAREAQDWRAVLAFWLTTLYAEDAARVALERRYFDSQPVLFPTLAQEWADLVERLEWLAEHAQALPALHTDGTSVRLDELRRQAGESAQARARELTLVARVEALERLGEHERVSVILALLAEP